MIEREQKTSAGETPHSWSAALSVQTQRNRPPIICNNLQNGPSMLKKLKLAITH